MHNIDTTTYYIYIRWEGDALFKEVKAHTYQLITDADALSFEVEYSSVRRDIASAIEAFRFDQAQKTTQKFWHKFWTETAFVDFSQCTDPRAKELERRVVLSQYLTRINCANNMPPQETGLTYNTWFGRPHLEMTWWHAVDFTLWNQPKVVEQMLRWYDKVAAPIAKKIAQRQGFKGIRWMKMTDPWAGEAPSNQGHSLDEDDRSMGWRGSIQHGFIPDMATTPLHLSCRRDVSCQSISRNPSQICRQRRSYCRVSC